MNRLIGTTKFKSLSDKIFALVRKISNNSARIELHRAKVDENRALILANSIANGAAIRKLAQEPFDTALLEILHSLNPHEESDDNKSDVKELLAYGLFLEHAKHQLEINRRVLALSKKLVNVNSDLIEINRLSTELTAEIAIGSDPLSAFEDAIKKIDVGEYHAADISRESESLLIDCQATEEKAERNSQQIKILNTESEKNREGILRNAKSIHSVCDQVESLGATED